MNLDEQIQALIDHAPQDGTTPLVLRAIAPALKALAGQLKHLEYYILQSAEGNWVVTTLSHRLQTSLEKTVVYAFASKEDALASAIAPAEQVTAKLMPTAHLLFQLVALQTVESIVFFDAKDTAQGTEVSRQNLNALIRQALQQQSAARTPPNLA